MSLSVFPKWKAQQQDPVGWGKFAHSITTPCKRNHQIVDHDKFEVQPINFVIEPE